MGLMVDTPLGRAKGGKAGLGVSIYTYIYIYIQYIHIWYMSHAFALTYWGSLRFMDQPASIPKIKYCEH